VRRYRETTTRCADERRLADEACNRCAIEGCRHHEHAQPGVEVGARIEGERKPQVRLQTALVELIEDHRGHALERRVLLQHAGEHALGDHLDARGTRDFGVQAHAVADGCPDCFPERVRHARRHRAGGEPARLEHEETPVRCPRLAQQHQRHHGALAGPRRGLEHRGALLA
jgi:hypothetical protein